MILLPLLRSETLQNQSREWMLLVTPIRGVGIDSSCQLQIFTIVISKGFIFQLTYLTSFIRWGFLWTIDQNLTAGVLRFVSQRYERYVFPLLLLICSDAAHLPGA